jgi:hypothetical protein
MRMTSFVVKPGTPSGKTRNDISSGANRSAPGDLPTATWRSFGAKSSAARLGVLLTTIAVLWANLDQLGQNVREALLSPTLNPVVISSRAQIDDAAVAALQRQLTASLAGAAAVPEAYARYELGNRRVSVPGNEVSTPAANTCATRSKREISLDIAGVHPAEPMLGHIPLDAVAPSAPQGARPAFADRPDEVWTAFMSRAALDQLRQRFAPSGRIGVICLEIRGIWLTAELVSIMAQPPRGRHGPYDVILSATQWRDFGPGYDRDLYDSAAFYFPTEPDVSTKIVALVRQHAAEAVEPPNTRLIQSLADAAGFERIAAALDRNYLSTIVLGLLAAASSIVVILIVSGFISQHFDGNIRAICVALAFGCGFRGIAAIELSRLALVVGPGAVLGAIFVVLVWGIDAAALTLRGGISIVAPDLPGRYALVVAAFVISATLLSLGLTGWWLVHIARRSLSEQLKQLD